MYLWGFVTDIPSNLVFAESVDKGFKNETKVRNELSASFFLKSRKSRACSLLNSLVWIQNSLQKLNMHSNIHTYYLLLVNCLRIIWLNKKIKNFDNKLQPLS